MILHSEHREYRKIRRNKDKQNARYNNEFFSTRTYTANGGCQQECVINNGAATCTCTTGTLNSDGKTCDPGRSDQYTLY